MPDSLKLSISGRVAIDGLKVIATCMALVPGFTHASPVTKSVDAHNDIALSATYTHHGRVLFIGRNKPDADASSSAVVVVDRATDLVGTPLDVISKDRMIGRSFVGSGSLPAGSPLRSLAVSSQFGMRTNPISGLYRQHQGMDLVAPSGTPVAATSNGIVDVAKWQGGYGLLVSLNHGKGVQTRYGHLSRLSVSQGQQVRKGDIIGYVGSTGNSTGPHLHYEVRLNGKAINPASLVKR